MEGEYFGQSLSVGETLLGGANSSSAFVAGRAFSTPRFKARMIAVLASRAVGSAVIRGVLEAFLKVSSGRVCAEYLLDSRGYGRMSTGLSPFSMDPFRAFSVSMRPKSNVAGDPPGGLAVSSVKEEAGNPLELKSDSTLTTIENTVRTSRGDVHRRRGERKLTEVSQTPPKV